MKCDECANFKARRVQTGWVCRKCDPDVCVGAFSPPIGGAVTPCYCVCNGMENAEWRPFYGKVVE